MINGEKLFNEPVKDNKITYQNTIKAATGKGHDYTIGCFSIIPTLKIVIK